MLRRPGRRSAATAPLGLDPHQAKLNLLSEADIFQGLTSSDMQEIERMTTMTSARKGRVLYSSESQGEVLLILKKGRVQLYRVAEDGRKLVTAILEAGSVFGESRCSRSAWPIARRRFSTTVCSAS